MDGKETKGFQKETITRYEYVCMPRPHFAYEAEIRALDDDELEEDELEEKYKKELMRVNTSFLNLRETIRNGSGSS